jgi:hypothetical protein
MMAFGGRWRINVENALASMRDRKASVDLADAAVPAGTSFPLSRNALRVSLYALASLADHWKSVLSRHMRWRIARTVPKILLLHNASS